MNPVFGPYTVNLTVHIINDENQQRGEATIEVGNGSMPTDAEIAERIIKVSSEISKKAPGYRLQTAPEFWDSVCLNKVGETFATPAEFREFAKP